MQDYVSVLKRKIQMKIMAVRTYEEINITTQVSDNNQPVANYNTYFIL